MLTATGDTVNPSQTGLLLSSPRDRRHPRKNHNSNQPLDNPYSVLSQTTQTGVAASLNQDRRLRPRATRARRFRQPTHRSRGRDKGICSFSPVMWRTVVGRVLDPVTRRRRLLRAWPGVLVCPAGVADLLTDNLRGIDALNAEGAEYVVIGWVAVNLPGLLRGTEDLDLFTRPTAENVSHLKRALKSVWDDPSIDESSAQHLCGAYPAFGYGPPDTDIYLDLLTRPGDFAGYADLTAEIKTVGGPDIRVARAATLVWMKQGTAAAIDPAGAARLRAAFDIEWTD
jgi:hypothetical protein